MTASSSRKKAGKIRSSRNRKPEGMRFQTAAREKHVSVLNRGEVGNVSPHVAHGVIVTRPEPGLSETLHAVEAAGWKAYASPSLDIEARTVRPLRGQFAAVVLTSGQAVPAARDAVPPDIPVYAVGDRTAQRAQAAGFTCVFSAQGDAEALAALLRKALPPQAGLLLLLSGAGQGMALAADLRHAGFRVVRRVAYKAQSVREVCVEVQSALRKKVISHILFFSAESARGWLRALPVALRKYAAATTGIVMSEAAEDILRHAGWQDVRVAHHPNAAALLHLLGKRG